MKKYMIKYRESALAIEKKGIKGIEFHSDLHTANQRILELIDKGLVVEVEVYDAPERFVYMEEDVKRLEYIC